MENREIINFLEKILTWDISKIDYEKEAVLIDRLIQVLDKSESLPNYFTSSGLEKEIFKTIFKSVQER